MKNTVKTNSVDLINADCLHFIQSLPDDSIDLIVTDPPYFKVKPNGWDNQWKGDEDYLKWLDHCLAQFWRVLKPAGSLYLFCGHRLASDIEIMMRERFNVLNHIIWAKPSGRWNGCNKESLRAYFPATERVLFAEHYQGPYRGKSDGYAAKERELKQHIMAPLISYFRDARAELGITAKQIAEATGKKNMVSHWFGASQWQLPNEADYRKLQALFSRIAAEKFQEQQLEQPHHQLVAWSEGTDNGRQPTRNHGYDVIVGGELFTDYSDHPRKLVKLNSKLKSTAAGRYQLLSRWWDAYRKQLGLKDFSPKSQDAVALQQIKERGALPMIDSGDIRQAIDRCSNIWASLPGAGYGQYEHKIGDLIARFKEAGGVVNEVEL